MKKIYKNIFFYIILSIFLLSANILQAEAITNPVQENFALVKEIKIIGNNRITEDTIRFYIYTKTGELYSSQGVREDIKRIYQIGHFDDVKVESQEEADGIILIYAVREKPSIHDVSISGNDDVSTEDIKEKITIKAGDVLDRGLIKKNIDSIKKLYIENGFYFAEITENIEETTSNQVDLKFIIAEGKKIRIKNIVFEGNKRFTGRKLRGILTTKEKGLFSFITGSGIYKEEVLKGDILKLESFYKDNGYLKIVVYEPEININKEEKRIEVTIRIKEGSEYKVGDISVTGDDTFSKEELFQDAVLIKGDIFKWSGLREDIYKINKLYSQKGFAYSDINPVIMIDDDKLKADITLEITKGKKFYVGNITIKGNDKTRDRVIRREFRFSEGEVFDSWKLERTRERIYNLEFFDDVKLDVKRGEEDDLLDIDVDVKERSTGQFSVSAGYSSVENFVFSTQISFNNLMGRGQKLSFTAEKSAIRRQFVIDFLEPRILDKEISAGFDLFTKRIDETNNDTNSYGGGFRLGKELGEYVHGSFRYRFKYLDIKSVANPNRFNEEGITKISSIMPEISRNTVDNFLNPSKGSNVVLNAELAGGPVFGGANFYKLEFEASKYFPLKWKFVGLLHGRAGFSEPFDKDVLIPITERYFLGGMADLRGYNSRDIGPRDGDGPLGGNKVVVLNAEIHYPFTDIVRGFLFYDRGNVYGHGIETDSLFKDRDDDYSFINMRHTFGVGVRIFTPIGPIGIAYGRRIDRDHGESAGEIQLFMGGVMF